MSRHWNPNKATVALDGAAPRPSRIRRDPLRTPGSEPAKPVKPRSTEQELISGVAGIILFGAMIAAAIVGLSIATFTRDDPSAAAALRRFNQCYNATGPNCVLNGETIYVAGNRIDIAGMDAPRIDGASCDAERSQGMEAATQLADILNSGRVSIGAPFTETTGQVVRKVEVKDNDIAKKMIGEGLAHVAGSKLGWCD